METNSNQEAVFDADITLDIAGVVCERCTAPSGVTADEMLRFNTSHSGEVTNFAWIDPKITDGIGAGDDAGDHVFLRLVPGSDMDLTRWSVVWTDDVTDNGIDNVIEAQGAGTLTGTFARLLVEGAWRTTELDGGSGVVDAEILTGNEADSLAPLLTNSCFGPGENNVANSSNEALLPSSTIRDRQLGLRNVENPYPWARVDARAGGEAYNNGCGVYSDRRSPGLKRYGAYLFGARLPRKWMGDLNEIGSALPANRVWPWW